MWGSAAWSRAARLTWGSGPHTSGNTLLRARRHWTPLYAIWTRIIIVPGFRFRVVDAMVTNFHQPQSTLLLLISAFVGGDWHTIYDFALAHGFRFLSYGDSSLLFRR